MEEVAGPAAILTAAGSAPDLAARCWNYSNSHPSSGRTPRGLDVTVPRLSRGNVASISTWSPTIVHEENDVRALITGGQGFVGGHLARHLRDAGDVVTVADREVDVTDRAALSTAMASSRPEVIYHLAAMTSVAESWKRPRSTRG